MRKLARTQRFTLGAPKEFAVAPDASRVLFLRSADGYDNKHSLWALDLDTGTESVVVDAGALLPGDEDLPPEERARRERARETGGGVVRYAVDAGHTTAAFSLAGKLYTVDLASGDVTLRVDSAAVDPRLNPTGTHVAYAAGGALRVVDLASGEDTVLADEPDDDVTWGLAEFIAAEEMRRSRGYWWAPDGKSVLAQRTDTSGVHRWHIADPANPSTPPASVAYPAAGTPNARVTLAFLGLDGSRVDVDLGAWEYVAAVHWSAGGPPLVTVQTRDQRRTDVLAVDPETGSTRQLYSDTDDAWVELVTGVPAWTEDGRLVRVVVADDAYRLMIDGELVTEPSLQVRSVVHVGREVLFTASADDPTQIHVYRTENGSVRQLSSVKGVTVAAGRADACVLSAWSLDHAGPRVSVVRDGHEPVSIAVHTADPGIEPRPKMMTVGERGLRAALLLPTGYQPGDGPLPVLLDPYGGPHAQRVLSTRNAFLTPQWFADQGFAVLVADGRGSPGRGPAWEKEIGGRCAEISLNDQVDALHAVAAEHPELDLNRVAIRGWSYGGYLSALAVLRRPDVFHAAVAGAPVTDWALYDTHYTERYLGHPEENPDAYRANSLIEDAPNLQRPLLIVHGMADDNVFVAHALRLSAALLKAGRPHEFLPLVATTHMTPADEDVAENLLQRQVDWLHEQLGGKEATGGGRDAGHDGQADVEQ